MKFAYYHITLLIGILLVFAGFLWFGRDTPAYMNINLIGLIVAGLSFLRILLSHDAARNKLFWTFTVIAAIALLWLTESELIKLSYKFYLNKNREELYSLSNSLMNKKGEVMISASTDSFPTETFSKEELASFKKKLQKIGVGSILKDSQKIFFRTWGAIDISHGIFFFFSDTVTDKRYRHITGHWYY